MKSYIVCISTAWGRKTRPPDSYVDVALGTVGTFGCDGKSFTTPVLNIHIIDDVLLSFLYEVSHSGRYANCVHFSVICANTALFNE